FEALSAAWSLCQELESLSLLYRVPVQLALGVVQGPCEVFASGQQLAYRGPACEQAQQALVYSAGQSLVVSEDLLQRPEMAMFLEDPLVQWQVLTPETGADTETSQRWL